MINDDDKTIKVECPTLGISVAMSNFKTHDVLAQLSNGGHLNNTNITMQLCCDSRGPDCPYWIVVEVNTEHLTFKQSFCGYNFRSKEAL